MTAPLLDVRDLTVTYANPGSSVVACAEVSLRLRPGEILGIAGESGSGKSTLITALTRLQRPPAVISSGEIVLRHDGVEADLARLDDRALRQLRWSRLSIVLQSAMDALNPVMRLGSQFADVLREHEQGMSARAVEGRTHELLAMVGIPTDRSRSYPHELSGGMRQRAAIALALACDPALVVMDEPTTAVDVVMQRQILGQILQLRERLGFAVIFVTHDLTLLLELADRIAIMYAGRIVEIGTAQEIYATPKHPYTKGLRDAFPPLHAPLQELSGIPGSPPNLADPPAGCAFHPRCAHRFDACDGSIPLLQKVGAQDVACLLYDADANPPTIPPELMSRVGQ